MSTSDNTQSTGIQRVERAGVTWIDVEQPSPADLEALEREYRLHPVHLNESIQKIQHTQVEREEDYLFFVLHVPLFDQQINKLVVKQIGIFLGKHYLITIRTGPSQETTNFFRLEEGAETYFKQGASYLLYALISRLLADISNITEEVVTALDDIEDSVFDNNGSDAQRIGKVRQAIVRLSRVIGPKRIVLEDLAEQVKSFTGHSMTKYYSNNTKTVTRLWEVIEEAKETVEIYKDADFTTSTERTNKILSVLTLIFTLTIPITVVGTIYGTNVPLPGGIEAGVWTFFGRFTTLIVLLGVSMVMATTMYIYFRKKRWF